jgi:colanic acid/amylovoran biosynthesis glycosyltransferase
LKIAYLVNDYPKVSHSFIRREILALERQGFEIQRIAMHGWANPLPDSEDQLERDKTLYVLRNGVLALILPTLKTLLTSPLRFYAALSLALKLSRGSHRSLPYHLVYLAEACRIIPWLNAFGAQRIHAHFGSNPTEVAMLAYALGGPPYSFTIHGPGDFAKPMGLDEKIHQSTFVVAISSFGRSQLYLNSRLESWPKINIVRCGLEEAFYATPPHTAADTSQFVCVGRFCEEKGQLLLISAVARLVAGGTRVQLVLAGDGPLRGKIEELINNYGLQKSVRITGWISSDQVRQELLAARALVLPSFAEGLPVVIMEALALRRPVLTTYIAGIPELVRHGENGWLFPAGSEEDLANAIKDCISRPAEDIKRGARARRGATFDRLRSCEARGTVPDGFSCAKSAARCAVIE